MDKLKFEEDILIVLSKHGFKIDGITDINIVLNYIQLPIIKISYFCEDSQITKGINKLIEGQKNV